MMISLIMRLEKLYQKKATLIKDNNDEKIHNEVL